jgi:hypothetical protein
LLSLYDYYTYCTDEFRKAMEEEIKYELDSFKSNSRIIIENVRFEREVKRLEWD